MVTPNVFIARYMVNSAQIFPTRFCISEKTHLRSNHETLD